MSDPSDKPKFDKKSSQRSSSELPPTESDFWDLEDGEAEPSAISPAPRSVGESQRVVDPAVTPAPTPPEEPAAPGPADLPDQLDPLEEDRPGEPPSPPAADESTSDPSTEPGHGLSKSEKLSVLIVAVCLLLGASWAVKLFFDHVPTESPEAKIEYPVTGNFAALDAAKTYWREPNPEADSGVRPDAKLIPAATITLGSSSASGALRFLFQDETGSIVGDPITLSVNNGTFTDGGKEREIYATAGFDDEGDHAAYLTDQIDTWYLLVKEGPDANAAGADFEDLCRIPISTTRH